MTERVFEPLPITYTGLFADAHLVDCQQFGRSLVGASKVANSVCHWFLFSEIADDAKQYNVRFYVGPSKENGLIQEIVAVMNSGSLPMFAPVLLKVGKSFIEKTIDAVIKTVLNRKSESALAIEGLLDQAKRHEEFVRQVHAGQMQDKAWMQDMIAMLAAQNRPALRELPEPVGRSVRQMQIGDTGVGPTIDEPAAEVMRARDPMQVGDLADYQVTVEGVFKTNGACRLKILGQEKVVAGKITDPQLGKPGNSYTTALNEGLPLQVKAKPTLKNGKLHTLYVSDARIEGR
jgi:hypothetical protein